MKKQTIALLLLIAATYTYAQNPIELSALQELCTYSSEKFDNYMLEHGYSINSQVSNGVTQLYLSDIEKSDGSKDQCSRTELAASGIISINASYSTTDKDYYLAFKESLSKAGYKYQKAEPISLSSNIKTIWYYYSNNDYTATLFSYSFKNGLTWYSMQVFKNQG